MPVGNLYNMQPYQTVEVALPMGKYNQRERANDAWGKGWGKEVAAEEGIFQL